MNILNHALKKTACFIYFLLLPVLAFPLNTPLKVGIISNPPFNIVEDNVIYTGIAIQIWSEIASINNWSYQYILLPNNYDSALKQVHDGKIDILVGPIDVNNQRLQLVDFSRPFFIEKMAIATPKTHSYFDIFHEFLSSALLYIAGISLLCFVIYTHLFWFFERGENQDISTNYFTGMSELIWRHILHTGVGLPKTFYGRLMSLVWLTLTVIVFTSYNASVTSALTLALSVDKKSPTLDQLKDMKLAGLTDTAKDIAKKEGFQLQITKTISEAFELLNKNKVDGVLDNDVMLKYYIQQNASAQKYIVTLVENKQNEVAFALPLNSPILRQLNLELTLLQDKKETVQICAQYLKNIDAERCDF